jgi:tetratricopeptide (TPR) repeat protein
MSGLSRAELVREKEQDDRFEKFVSILIASVTVLAAITAFMQTRASAEASRANRLAQNYSISATTQKLSGAVQFSYDWQGAFQTWRELDLQVTAAEQEGDTAAAARYRQLRDHMVVVSPMLQPPYFDGTWPDSAKYEVDLFLVESTRASEHFEAEAELGSGLDEIANALVIQLTLLAVALALYGLATTMGGWIKWMFVMVGSGMVGLCIIWLSLTVIWPRPDLPDAAIDAYARGYGQAYQFNHEAAIAQYNQAIEIAPDYANAYWQRGDSYYSLGKYQEAIADYVAAQENGRDDTTVGWNLGWVYYLLGRYDLAVAVDRHVLELDPTVVGVQLNLALTLMAQGNFDASRVEYDKALAEATRQVAEARAAGEEPSSSLWVYLDAGGADIENLLDQVNGTPNPWTQAPPASAVTADPATQEQLKRLKEHTVALEYNSAPPSVPTSAIVSDFVFGVEVFDSNGEFVRYDTSDQFLYGTNAMIILFNYAGFQTGQQEIWKVYVDGQEDPALRVVSTWALEDSGAGAKAISYASSNVFIFSPGEYVVELYVDTELLKRGTFRVLEP